MMLQLNLVPLMATILCGASLLISVSAKRPFNHRSDLEDMPPVSELGYEVPLVGSKTCVAESSCKRNVSIHETTSLTLYSPRHIFSPVAQLGQKPSAINARAWCSNLYLQR